MIFDYPAPSSAPKAELEFVPPSDPVRSGLAEADLKLLFTKSNRILIQDVFVQPFSENVAPGVLEKLTENILAPVQNRWQASPDFKVVTSRLSCVPSLECKFTWLRVGFELGDEEHAAVRPIACKLYPESRQDTVKITSSVEISGELTVKLAKTSIKQQDGTEHEKHQYNINTYGSFSPTPAWDFLKTEVNPEVIGDLTLLMVVASPKGAQSAGKISLSARAELRSGSIIQLVMRRTSQNAAAVTFGI